MMSLHHTAALQKSSATVWCRGIQLLEKYLTIVENVPTILGSRLKVLANRADRCQRLWINISNIFIHVLRRHYALPPFIYLQKYECIIFGIEWLLRSDVTTPNYVSSTNILFFSTLRGYVNTVFKIHLTRYN